MKTLRSDTLVGRLAFCDVPEDKIPEEVSVCHLFLVFLLNGIGLLLESLLLLLIGGVIVRMVALVLFGAWTKLEISIEDRGFDFEYIRWWPKIRGVHIAPIIPIGLAVVLWGVVKLFIGAVRVMAALVAIATLSSIGVIVVLGILVLALSPLLLKTSPVALTIEFISAKKHRWCPIVKIEKVAPATS